jgi:hypothetical protein|eukprot:SAG25_NODE_2021_length_2018_cov_2.743505_2_plen_81_part_00
MNKAADTAQLHSKCSQASAVSQRSDRCAAPTCCRAPTGSLSADSSGRPLSPPDEQPTIPLSASVNPIGACTVVSKGQRWS